MPETILVVDDEPNYRLVLGQVLANEGFDVVEAQSGGEAIDLFLERPQVGLVLTDITMPGGDGMELLTKVKKERPEVPVVMLTAHIDVKLAVEAMQKGAFDYLTKPYHNDELIRCVRKALEVFGLSRQNKELREALSKRHSFGSLIGKSKSMVELYQLLEKVAPTRANVLITGESGTGKELVARAIHYNSPRSERSFVAVNCSALPESLLTSELFGYEKGAFTGAVSGRMGRFELAHGGTLFLDEVAEMEPSIQVTLLRVLQERTIERVGGGGKLIEVDVRLVSATNRDLKSEAAAGRFREDLFYRLNVVHLRLPPLRERLDDLPMLTEHFLEKFSGDRRVRPTLDAETKRLLYAYRWPGNVRELENIIERALILASGDVIMPSDLPEELRRPSSGPTVVSGHRSGQERTFLEEPLRQGALPKNEPEGASTPFTGPQSPSNYGSLFSAFPAGSLGAGSDFESGPWTGPLFSDFGSDWPEPALRLLPKGVGLTEALSALEEGILRKALKAGDGVQSRAADALGLKRNVFKYKWDKWAQSAPTPLSEQLAEILPDGSDLLSVMAAMEEEMLRRALVLSRGVQTKAADLLGLKRNVMPYKLKKYPALSTIVDEGNSLV
jgi:two-component system NtrC family response regulator